MSSKSKDREIYVRQYPEAKKWLNQCVVCGSVGYKPELPDEVYLGRLAENIRKMFAPLAVNDISICEQCAKHWDK